MQCGYIKDNQEQCGAQALVGKKLCFTHDPESSSKRAEANKNGGLARRQYEFYSDPITINEPKDIQKLMELTINGLLMGMIPASQPANSLGFLARCWLDAYETNELKKKVEQMEARLADYVLTHHKTQPAG